MWYINRWEKNKEKMWLRVGLNETRTWSKLSFLLSGNQHTHHQEDRQGMSRKQRESWWGWQSWWWWLGVSYVKALTALTASANICHFRRAWILDLMCLNWFSSAWHRLSHCHSLPLTHHPFFLAISLALCLSCITGNMGSRQTKMNGL